MRPHPFAALIYSVEDTLGLWHQERKSQQLNRPPFDAHREHFQNIEPDQCYIDDYLSTLDEICRRLHQGCNVPPEVLYNHISILESVYNFLSHQANFFEAFEPNPVRFYIKSALIPLICCDISIFKENASEKSIYFHLDRILKNESVIKYGEDDGQFKHGTLDKNFAKRYISSYIKDRFKCTTNTNSNELNPDILIPEILNYIENITKKGNQTCSTLNQKVNIAINRQSNKNKPDLVFNFHAIAAAYTAIIILQDIDNKTNSFGLLVDIYNRITSKNNAILNNLKASLLHALRKRHGEIDHIKHALCLCLDSSPQKLLFDEKYECIKKIYECIFKFQESNFHLECLPKGHNINAMLKQQQYLSKMISPPPQLDIPMIFSNKNLYHKYREKSSIFNLLIFNRNSVQGIIDIAANQVDATSVFFGQYKPLIDSIIHIQAENPSAALKSIEGTREGKFPFAGFVKYALAVLNIGLLYKIKRKNIKHLSLMRQVNDIINHQGFVAITTPKSTHVSSHNHTSWLSEDVYLEYSILRGKNTYNAIIAQAIYSYNFSIARHTTMIDNISSCSNRVKITDVNYSSQLISHDLLSRLNFISGKVLDNLEKIDTNLQSDKFADFIVEEQIISLADMTDDLIHCIAGSTLAVCLLDSLTLILLFSVPGDDVENIITLSEKTRIVELLFEAYKLHVSSK